MNRTCASCVASCIAFLAPLVLEVRADPIQMTVTGNAGLGPVNYSQILPVDTVEDGYASYPGTLGSKTVGPEPTGSINVPISLTIGLTDTAAPGAQGLTLSLSGSLTGQFLPSNSPVNPSADPGVEGSGTISEITISGLDPATHQVVSATTYGPNGVLGADVLAQFAAISSIPQPLLAMLTTPSQYNVIPDMGGGIMGDYYEQMVINPLSTVTPIPTPEPTPFALLGLATVSYLVKRAQAARKASIPRS
jgi:hypothetical protein